VERDDLRQFAQRDWSSMAAAKARYWVDQYRMHGAHPARRASLMLLEHARHVQAGFPSVADRATDLSNHVKLAERLNRAARAFTGR